MSVFTRGRQGAPNAPFNNSGNSETPKATWDGFATAADAAKDMTELRVGRPGNPRYEGAVAVTGFLTGEQAQKPVIAAQTAGDIVAGVEPGAVLEAGERFTALPEQAPQGATTPVEHVDVA